MTLKYVRGADSYVFVQAGKPVRLPGKPLFYASRLLAMEAAVS